MEKQTSLTGHVCLKFPALIFVFLFSFQYVPVKLTMFAEKFSLVDKLKISGEVFL